MLQTSTNMDVLIGILVDVSGSMQQKIDDRPSIDQRGGTWAKSIFNFIDRLITHDASSEHQVFVIGFGSSRQSRTFDVLTTLEALQALLPATGEKRPMLEEAVEIVERNGAPRVRTWATIDQLDYVVGKWEIAVLLDALKKQPDFRHKFIYKCLPAQCREFQHGVSPYAREIANWATQKDIHNRHRVKSIKEVITDGIGLLKEYNDMLKEVTDKAVYGVKRASEISRGSLGEEKLTDRRADELLQSIEPYIYGDSTPLMQSLHEAVKLFRARIHHQYKVLFILSDGLPTDGFYPPLRELDNLNVIVVCCYITLDHSAESCRLYSSCNPDWEFGAKFMFHMSSLIPTQKIPRTLFVKKGWKIDIDNKETRAFCQINHPDLIDEVCDTVKYCVLSQDSLSDVLSSVSLDIYINGANEGFQPEQQPPGKTCYAHAAATVIHLAMKRIVGREGGYPDFRGVRDKLIERYGKDGAKVGEVLGYVCSDYRLRCRKRDEYGALRAVMKKRPVVAIYQLSHAEWRTFNTFYDHTPRGILTRRYLEVFSRCFEGTERRGHAVVLTSFNYESLRLMNSKGSDWADGGFFRVQNSAVLGLKFYEVYWKEEDLLPSEKEAYDRYGPDISAKLMKSLTSLQTATYACPLCSAESNVSKFSGHLLKAQCPRCRETFNANQAESDLALNIYLTSLWSSDTCTSRTYAAATERRESIPSECKTH